MSTAARMQTINGTAAVIRSQAMQRLMAMVERVAGHDAAVLIVGETGVGKELAARAVHEHSPRNRHAFVDVNCAALPEHLVESELFGYEKGAFSGADSTKPGLFEIANLGTIFLDEIGELDIKIQAKLLRVLDGAAYFRLGGRNKIEVNVRVIAATNRDLEQEVASGRFRSDLYHRLTQFHLQIPPLRERGEDVKALAENFLQRHCPSAKFTDDALDALQRYSWPGNVRELKNVVFKATVNAPSGKQEFGARDLPAEICGTNEQISQTGKFEGNLEEMERRMILQAMEQSGGNQGKAAQQLGISTRTLRRKLEKYRKSDGDAKSSLGRLSAQQQRYFRVTIQAPVVIRDLDEGGEPVQAVTANVSSGGIAVQSPVPLKHGSTFEVSVSMPGLSAQLEAKAKLAWASPDGLAGLSFVEIHPAVEKELQSWLSSRAYEEGWNSTGPGSS